LTKQICLDSHLAESVFSVSKPQLILPSNSSVGLVFRFCWIANNNCPGQGLSAPCPCQHYTLPSPRQLLLYVLLIKNVKSKCFHAPYFPDHHAHRTAFIAAEMHLSPICREIVFTGLSLAYVKLCSNVVSSSKMSVFLYSISSSVSFSPVTLSFTMYSRLSSSSCMQTHVYKTHNIEYIIHYKEIISSELRVDNN
jgi:hypothetical protein